MAQNDTQGSAKKWSTGKKILVGGSVGVVVVLGLGVLLAPTIAGAVAPGLISSNAAKFVKGKVSAKSASFSWGGPQRVEGISWVDEKGQPVLATTVSTSAGLIGLISGGLDLGEVEIRDTTAQIVRAKDGTLNVQALMVEQKGAGSSASGTGSGKDSGKPIQLPNGLKVRVSIKNLDATFVDESAQTNGAAPLTVKLSGVEGNATVDPKTNLVAKLVANANSNVGGAGSGAGGKINVDIDAANWADGSGVVTLDKATVKAKVDVANLPMSLVDAIVGPVVKDENGVGVPLATSLGERVQLNIDANGTMKDATAFLKFVTDRANANGELRIADGVLTTSKPLTISLQGAAVPDLVPAMRAALKSDAQTRVEAMPDATVTVDNLRIVLPQGGKALDLRGASANVAIATTEVRGTVVAGGQTQAMKIAALNAKLSASDFAQGATISAKTTATLNNQPAGDIDVQASLTGLLDSAGAPVKGLPSGVNASVKVKQIATAVAQPFVQGMNLDLQRDIGPTLDVDLKAVSSAAQGAATAPINIDFTVNAAAMRGNGALTLREDALLARDKGVTFEVDAAGRLAEAITRDGVGGGWRVSGTGGAPGKASVKIGWLNLPLTAEKSPRLEAADGQLVVAVEGLTLTKMEVDSAGKIGTKVLGAIDVPQFGGGFALKKGGALDVGMQGKLRYAGQDSGIGANFSVPGVVIANTDKSAKQSWMVAEPITLRPEGGVEIVNLPVGMMGMFVASDGSDGTNAANSGGAAGTATEKKLDIAALLRDVIGPGVTIRANTKKGASGDLALAALADSGAMKFNTKANLSETSIAMSELELRCTLTPQSADAVFARLAPESKDMPKLASPATAVVTVSPLTIPLDKDRKPKLAEAGTVRARVALPGRVMVRDIKTSETQRASAGIEEFVLDVEAPVASLISAEQGGKGGTAKATFKGNVIGQQNENLAALSGDGMFQLAGGKPQQMKMTANVVQINTGSIDTLLGKDGLVRGALGDSASVKVIADVDSVKNDTSAEIAITAPNVTTTGPLKVRSLVDRIELVQPARFTVQAQPSFVEALFKPSTSIPTSGKEVKEAVQAALALKQPTTIDISLNKLVLPKAATAGAKAPAPDVNVLLDIPSLALRTSDNKGLNVNKTKLTLETAASSGAGSTDKPLNFAWTMDQVVVEGAEQSGGGVSLTGNVTNLVGADGGFSMDGALLNARGAMPSVPTALVDVLAKKDGLLVEALGPVIELNLVAERYPLMGKPIAGIAPGLLDLQAKSARANASVKGNISDAVLVCDQPVSANLLEISAALAGRVVKGLPLLGTFEKLREDRPASITATGLRVPLSNDLSKLGGVVVIDPGQLRFGAGSEFTKLLNLAKIKTSGVAGQRLEPLTITVTNGVASYPKWRVPLGEFTMETEGTVDLVNRRVDVVTWIPLGALADEAAGIFNTGAGGKLNQILGDAVPVLDAASMLPFRTKGSMDDPETGADLELFGKTFVKNLRPDKLIEKGLGDLFKKKDK